MRNLNILLVIVAFLFINEGAAFAKRIGLKNLQHTVAYLRQETLVRKDIEGKSYEIWLKADDQTAPKPWIQSSIGTGFFVEHQNKLFLVTAAHVANKMFDSATVTIHGKENKPIKLKIQDLCGYVDSPRWVQHPHADVAVLQLNPSSEFQNQYLLNKFLQSSILVKELVAPTITIQVAVLGFPISLGVKKHFSPLIMRSYVSSGLLELKTQSGRIDTFFVLEQPSIGGYSGAPVFDLVGPTLGEGTAFKVTNRPQKCYGLIHGTLPDKTGSKLAVVVPSALIVETLNMSVNNSLTTQSTGPDSAPNGAPSGR